jgi:hypothetical protein
MTQLAIANVHLPASSGCGGEDIGSSAGTVLVSVLTCTCLCSVESVPVRRFNPCMYVCLKDFMCLTGSICKLCVLHLVFNFQGAYGQYSQKTCHGDIK